MNILAIPATNSRAGMNRALLIYAAKVIEEIGGSAAKVELVDLNAFEFAIYSPEREAATGIPAGARALFDKIGASDALMLSFAEYNGSFTPAWKNTYDWMSRIDQAVYQRKKVAMFAATPGPRAGAGVLGSATSGAPHFGANLVGHLGIGRFRHNFDAGSGRLTSNELDEQLRALLRRLISDVGSE